MLEGLLFERQMATTTCEGVEEKEPLHTLGENVPWNSHFGKQNVGSSKI